MMQSDMFKETTVVQSQWLVYYNAFTIIILISSYMLKNEVRKAIICTINYVAK